MAKKEENDLKTNHPLSSALELLDLVIQSPASKNFHQVQLRVEPTAAMREAPFPCFL